MKNYIQPGHKLTLTAPSGGVVSGGGYVIGSLLVFAESTVAEGLPFVGLTDGVVEAGKTTGQVWAEGEKLFWNDTTKKFTDTTGSGFFIEAGVAVAAALTGDTTGLVKLSARPLTAA